MVEPIAWEWAERVAHRVSPNEPLSGSYLAESLEADFAEFGQLAEQLVSDATGLTSTKGPTRVRVIDRSEWVTVNITAFRKTLRPLTDKFAARLRPGVMAGVGRHVTATEMGALLGWMSTRVLGQYDVSLYDDDTDQHDIVYFVGPNILAMEKRFGFPPREFRLWIALHEVAHRMQFTGVPWMTDYFGGMVRELLSSTETNPRKFLESLAKAAKAARSGDERVKENGIVGLVASEKQLEIIGRIQGLMALLEGHGDVVMNEAATDLIPSADRFHRVLHDRRRKAAGTGKVLQRLLGLEAKLRQYEQGERFIEAVEAEGGRQLFDRVWEKPENLPTAKEIADPAMWTARVSSSEFFSK